MSLEQESLHEFAQNFAARHAARDAARAPTAPESGDGRACQPAKAISADNVVRSGGEQDKGESLLEFARNFAARYAARGATRAPQALKRARLPLGVIAVNAAAVPAANKCHKARPAVKQLPSPRRARLGARRSRRVRAAPGPAALSSASTAPSPSTMPA